jgi:hypothetical protein
MERKNAPDVLTRWKSLHAAFAPHCSTSFDQWSSPGLSGARLKKSR